MKEEPIKLSVKVAGDNMKQPMARLLGIGWQY